MYGTRKTTKLSLAFLLSGLLAGTAFAVDEESIKNYNTEHLNQFYYTKGFKEGVENGYKEGYKEALEFSKKQLRLYKDKIKALESGKYLKEHSGKITNPEIYQVKNGDTIKVIVRGCRIEKQLTPDEIIDLPHYPIDANCNNKFEYHNVEGENKPIFNSDLKGVTNSVDVMGRDGNGFYSDRASNPYTNENSYYYLENTSTLRKQLDVLNYTYAIEDNKIKVIFGNENERKSFLENMGY
jgi:hypothetical protein